MEAPGIAAVGALTGATGACGSFALTTGLDVRSASISEIVTGEEKKTLPSSSIRPR